MKVRRAVIALLIMGILAAYMGLMLWKGGPGVVRNHLRLAYGCLRSFIESEGRFPLSEDELIEKGYYDRSTSPGRIKLPPGYMDSEKVDSAEEQWFLCGHFSNFDIQYGIRLDDLYVRYGSLWSRKSSGRIRLIDGPFASVVPYEELSLELYRLMLAEANKESLE
ncbi:MAG: hypothetical protein IH624_18310 [Phycisphaerae bacterium]|nr:hypothetical protein [Phycisphaerae bacterium]